jgi:hypothetical protein
MILSRRCWCFSGSTVRIASVGSSICRLATGCLAARRRASLTATPIAIKIGIQYFAVPSTTRSQGGRAMSGRLMSGHGIDGRSIVGSQSRIQPITRWRSSCSTTAIPSSATTALPTASATCRDAYSFGYRRWNARSRAASVPEGGSNSYRSAFAKPSTSAMPSGSRSAASSDSPCGFGTNRNVLPITPGTRLSTRTVGGFGSSGGACSGWPASGTGSSKRNTPDPSPTRRPSRNSLISVRHPTRRAAISSVDPSHTRCERLGDGDCTITVSMAQ